MGQASEELLRCPSPPVLLPWCSPGGGTWGSDEAQVMQSKEPPLEQGRPPGEGHSRHTKAFSCQGREEGQEEIVRESRGRV